MNTKIIIIGIILSLLFVIGCSPKFDEDTIFVPNLNISLDQYDCEFLEDAWQRGGFVYCQHHHSEMIDLHYVDKKSKHLHTICPRKFTRELIEHEQLIKGCFD